MLMLMSLMRSARGRPRRNSRRRRKTGRPRKPPHRRGSPALRGCIRLAYRPRRAANTPDPCRMCLRLYTDTVQLRLRSRHPWSCRWDFHRRRRNNLGPTRPQARQKARGGTREDGTSLRRRGLGRRVVFGVATGRRVGQRRLNGPMARSHRPHSGTEPQDLWPHVSRRHIGLTAITSDLPTLRGANRSCCPTTGAPLLCGSSRDASDRCPSVANLARGSLPHWNPQEAPPTKQSPPRARLDVRWWLS